MLAIRLQRLGRKALPVYRLAVQEAQRHPSSGRVVKYVGTYNPHTKAVNLDKEKIVTYMQNGAKPTPRVIRLLTAEKMDLPKWVKLPSNKQKAVRHPEKLRKNRPVEIQQEAPAAPATAESNPDTAEA